MELFKQEMISTCIYVIAIVFIVKLIFEPLEKLFHAIKNKSKYSKGIMYKDYYQYKTQQNYTNNPYTVNKLLNEQEYQFYLHLENECNNKNFIVVPKIKVEHFSTLPYTEIPVDFLICDKKFNVMAGIELEINDNKKIIESTFHKIHKPIYLIDIHNPEYKEQVSNIIKFL